MQLATMLVCQKPKMAHMLFYQNMIHNVNPPPRSTYITCIQNIGGFFFIYKKRFICEILRAMTKLNIFNIYIIHLINWFYRNTSGKLMGNRKWNKRVLGWVCSACIES